MREAQARCRRDRGCRRGHQRDRHTTRRGDAPREIKTWRNTTTIFSRSAPARAACARAATPPVSAPGGGRRGTLSRRHLRQRRLHSEETVFLCGALRRGHRRCRRLRLERGARRVRLANTDRKQGSRNRAPERGLCEVCSPAPVSSCSKARATRRRCAYRGGRTAAASARAISSSPPAAGRWCRRFPAPNSPSVPTRPSICGNCRGACWWSGGGYIAVEFASIFNGLGVDTTLVYRGERLLQGFDADLGRFSRRADAA